MAFVKTITIPLNRVTAIVEGYCIKYDYELSKLPGESKNQFANRLFDEPQRYLYRIGAMSLRSNEISTLTSSINADIEAEVGDITTV